MYKKIYNTMEFHVNMSPNFAPNFVSLALVDILSRFWIMDDWIHELRYKTIKSLTSLPS